MGLNDYVFEGEEEMSYGNAQESQFISSSEELKDILKLDYNSPFCLVKSSIQPISIRSANISIDAIEEEKQQTTQPPSDRQISAQMCVPVSQKRIRKKKQRRASFMSIVLPATIQPSNELFHIYGDITMSSDLKIRLNGALSWVFVGVEYLKGKQVTATNSMIEIAMEYSNNLSRLSIDQVVKRISHIHSPQYLKFKEYLQMLNWYLNEKKKEVMQSPRWSIQQEQFYAEFCRVSRERINLTAENSPLFAYTIGRCHMFTGHVDIKHLGYSREFLNLLCLNSDILQQMYLRNKPVNLFFDDAHIQELSLFHLESRMKKEVQLKTRMKVRTIDGYDLWLNQTMVKVHDMHETDRREYFFNTITKFDIDMHDLSGLIEYRNSLANSKGCSFERFIQVELSQMLEDVEYSVQSQLLLEKYYSDSVKELKGLQKLMTKDKLECGYRQINNLI